MTGIISDNVGRPSGLIKAGSVAGGAWTKIKEQTASTSATISFVDGTSDVVLDSTYPIYKFVFINIHPSASTYFEVGFRDGSTDYDATKTTTVLYTYHIPGGNVRFLYNESEDLAQSTAFQHLTSSAQVGLENNECMSGELLLYNPSSTVFVKHFIADTNYISNDATTHCVRNFTAGYINVTAAIDAVQFKMTTGNMDSGKIKLYGLSDS